MTDSRPSSPSQAELLQRDGVLLIVDSVQPPSGPVPKGQTPVLEAQGSKGCLSPLCGSGEIYAFNGHVDLGTGVRTALGQIVAEELYLRMDQVRMVLGDTERAPNQGCHYRQRHAADLRRAAAQRRRRSAPLAVAPGGAALRCAGGTADAGGGRDPQPAGAGAQLRRAGGRRSCRAVDFRRRAAETAGGVSPGGHQRRARRYSGQGDRRNHLRTRYAPAKHAARPGGAAAPMPVTTAANLSAPACWRWTKPRSRIFPASSNWW